MTRNRAAIGHRPFHTKSAIKQRYVAYAPHLAGCSCRGVRDRAARRELCRHGLPMRAGLREPWPALSGLRRALHDHAHATSGAAGPTGTDSARAVDVRRRTSAKRAQCQSNAAACRDARRNPNAATQDTSAADASAAQHASPAQAKKDECLNRACGAGRSQMRSTLHGSRTALSILHEGVHASVTGERCAC